MLEATSPIPHENSAAIQIARRLGVVLLVGAFCQFSYIAHFAAQGQIIRDKSYIIFCILGSCLLNGKIRLVNIGRLFAIFLLATFFGMMLIEPFFYPMSLLRVQIQLLPPSFRDVLIGDLSFVGVCGIIAIVLSRKPLLAAYKFDGYRRRMISIPIVIGFAFGAITDRTALLYLTRSEDAQRAIESATAKLGLGYLYWVHGIVQPKKSTDTTVTAVVVGWKDDEIHELPVTWRRDP